MALIQIPDPAAETYRGWLRLYERVTGKDAGPVERTEALFAALRGTRPWWHNHEAWYGTTGLTQ